jgi:hypothetical protein
MLTDRQNIKELDKVISDLGLAIGEIGCEEIDNHYGLSTPESRAKSARLLKQTIDRSLHELIEIRDAIAIAQQLKEYDRTTLMEWVKKYIKTHVMQAIKAAPRAI